MCVDYTDLNKHYPKDPFGLPHIDEVIDSTDDYELLCFLDCYFGLSLDHAKQRRPNQDVLHHALRCLLLHDHILWAQERGCDLSKSNPALPQGPDQEEH